MSFTDWRQAGADRRWITIAVLCLSCYCSYAGAQQFGRLFTTPEERQRLQELREAKKHTPRTQDDTGNVSRGVGDKRIGRKAGLGHAGISRRTEENRHVMEDSPPGSVITLKGIVYRQDKTWMAWINDGNAQEGAATLGYRELGEGERLDNKVTIEVPVTGKSVKLKPGQSYHLQSGIVFDIKEKSP